MYGVNIIASVLLAIFIFLPENLHPEDYQRADNVCQNNEGLDYIELDPFHIDVECKNGASFSLLKLIYTEESDSDD